MKHVAVADLSAQLPSLLDDVARGEEITLMLDGKAVARIVATPDHTILAPEVSPEQIEKRREAVQRLRAMAKARGTNFSQEEIKSWIEDGRH